MQKIELLYNQSYSANTALENFGLQDNIEPAIFKTQQVVNMNKEYYSYSNRIGVSIVNDLNVKTFLDKPENEKIAIDFIDYLKKIMTIDEFRDLFYDNKKLAEFFNSYYNKFINYSEQNQNQKTNDPNVDLEQLKNELFNQDRLYLKSNSYVNYDTSQENINTRVAGSENGMRTIPTDYVNFTGNSENYYLDIQIRSNKTFITNTNFSDYFKDTCDGTINFRKYTLVNSLTTNYKYVNLEELNRLKQFYGSNYGPSQESLGNLLKLLPENFFLNNYETPENQLPAGENVQVSSNVFFNNPISNSIITLPQSYNVSHFKNFQGFNDFKNFFGFNYKPYSPNFSSPDQAKDKYIYSQSILDVNVGQQLLKNPIFSARAGANMEEWGTYAWKPNWPNNYYNKWKRYPLPGRNYMTRTPGLPEPLYQEISFFPGNSFRIEITTSNVTDGYLIVFLGLDNQQSFLYREDFSQSAPIYGNGTFSFYLTYEYRGENPFGRGMRGIGIIPSQYWQGYITEVKMYDADDVAWSLDFDVYSPEYLGQKFDPLVENKYKIKIKTTGTPVQKECIVQYEYFSPSTIGPDNGFNSFNMNIPSSNGLIDENNSTLNVIIPTGATIFEHEINIYKNWTVRNPIVLSLRNYDRPSEIISYLVIYLDEFYDLTTQSVSSQLNVTESLACNLLYNGFVYRNFNDNFLQFYRPNNIPSYYDNGLGFTLQAPFSEVNLNIINQAFLNYFGDNSLNIENLLRQLNISENAIYNIYANKPLEFEKIDTEFYYDIIIVSESAVGSSMIDIGNYKILLYDPIDFQKELNEFISINEQKNGLLEEKIFFAHFAENAGNEIFERIEFSTNISKTDFVNKAIKLSESQFMDAEKYYNSRELRKFKKRIWESLRALVLGIQYVKFGKITDLYATQNYIMELNYKFYTFQEVKDNFLPKLNMLKEEILSL